MKIFSRRNTTTKTVIAAIVASLACVTLAISSARADGVTESVSRAAAAGVLDTAKSAEGHQVAKTLVNAAGQAAGDAAPGVVSQIVKQAHADRKQIGDVAERAAAGAARGVAREIAAVSGEHPAQSVASAAELVTAAAVHAAVSEARPDPSTVRDIAAAVTRGVMSEVKISSVTAAVIAFFIGAALALLGAGSLVALAAPVLLVAAVKKRRAAPQKTAKK